MAIESDTQDFTTAPTPIGTSRGGRMALIVRNPAASGATLCIGADDVDADNAAFLLAPGDPSIVITNGERDSLAGEGWHGAAATGTAAGVAVTEV